MCVLARQVASDNTGVHVGVKAGAHVQGPCFGWSKGAVDDRDGSDDPLSFTVKSARPMARRRYGRLTSQGTPCIIQEGLQLTLVDIKLDQTTWAASSRQLP